MTAHVRFQARVKRKRKEAADFLFALARKGPWEINSCMDETAFSHGPFTSATSAVASVDSIITKENGKKEERRKKKERLKKLKRN